VDARVLVGESHGPAALLRDLTHGDHAPALARCPPPGRRLAGACCPSASGGWEVAATSWWVSASLQRWRSSTGPPTDGRQAPTPPGRPAAVLRGASALEGRAPDWQLGARGVRAPPPEGVAAAIDERSVQRYGRWPWGRELLGRAVPRLHEAGPAAIGLDITF